MKLQIDPHCCGCPSDTEPNGVPPSEHVGTLLVWGDSVMEGEDEGAPLSGS